MMRNSSRIRGEGHYWLSRIQLSVLGVTALSLVALAFSVGLMIGREQAVSGDGGALASNGLIRSEVEEDALTDLLARVEQANANPRPAADLPASLRGPSSDGDAPPPAAESLQGTLLDEGDPALAPLEDEPGDGAIEAEQEETQEPPG